RARGHGVIASGDDLSRTASIFTALVPIDAKLPASTRLVVNAMLTRKLIIDIATDLKEIADSERRSRSDALQMRSQPGQRVKTRRYRSKSPNRGRPREGKKQ